MFSKESQRLFLDLPVQAVSQIGDDAQADEAHNDSLNVIAATLDQIERDDGKRNPEEHLTVLVDEYFVESRFHQKSQ